MRDKISPHIQLARLQIEFTHHLWLETNAFEARHREPSERAIVWSGRRLIIFAALKQPCSIHVHILTQHRVLPKQFTGILPVKAD